MSSSEAAIVELSMNKAIKVEMIKNIAKTIKEILKNLLLLIEIQKIIKKIIFDTKETNRTNPAVGSKALNRENDIITIDTVKNSM